MISKVNFLLGLVGLLVTTVSYAQTSGTSLADINGSPYLDDTYADGVIFYADKTLAAQIRYNAYQDLIEYKNNGKALVLDPTLTIKKVRFGTSTFIPQQYELKGKSQLGYFMVLDTGRVTLYSKKKIVYIAAKKGGALDGGDLPAQFKGSPDAFYYRIADGPILEVGNIKSMISSFPDNQEALTQFVKKEKISPKKEQELIQLIAYYNTLFDPTAVSTTKPPR